MFNLRPFHILSFSAPYYDGFLRFKGVVRLFAKSSNKGKSGKRKMTSMQARRMALAHSGEMQWCAGKLRSAAVPWDTKIMGMQMYLWKDHCSKPSGLCGGLSSKASAGCFRSRSSSCSSPDQTVSCSTADTTVLHRRQTLPANKTAACVEHHSKRFSAPNPAWLHWHKTYSTSLSSASTDAIGFLCRCAAGWDCTAAVANLQVDRLQVDRE